jgi:hypothetical protein
MRLLKAFLTLFCVWFFVDCIIAIHAIYSPHNEVNSPSRDRRLMAASFIAALVYAAALYGIHKRTVMTWRLGWVFLAANYFGFVFQVHSSMRKVPQAENPWVPTAAGAIAAAAVAVYWGYWWNRQRSYFVEPASHK